MRKTAIFVLLTGYLFALFSVPVAGIDFLIDPVGWLVAWNAIRALQKLDAVYGISASLCLGLTILSAIQMFVTISTVSVLLIALRKTFEIVLLVLLATGFSRILPSNRRGFDLWALWIVFVLNCIAPILELLLAFFPQCSFSGLLQIMITILHWLLIAEFCKLAFALNGS